MKIKNLLKDATIALFSSIVCLSCSVSQPVDQDVLIVNYADTLQLWDGFGVNYVETCQTPDYDSLPQDYGGFNLLTNAQHEEIIELIFGENGLRPEIIKMFLDPHHEIQNDNDDPYTINASAFDHEKTTGYMRKFVEGGLDLLHQQGIEAEIITTLYGPPGWMSLQKAHRGRDLDPAMREELGEYMVSWVKYLQDNGYPVKYLSVHNEGEDYRRWTKDGYTDDLSKDYNMYWSPDQVVDYLKLMPQMLEKHDVYGVGVTPGETSTWFRLTINFRKDNGSYAGAIGLDDEALNNMAIITSHSFWNPSPSGIQFLRDRRFRWDGSPPIHAWTTSTGMKEMHADFLASCHDEIYSAGVNAIIPWAIIQHHDSWIGDNLNFGNAINVTGPDQYEVRTGYYFYKHLTTAGRRGMRVINTASGNKDIRIIAFADNGTGHPDTFIVVNNTDQERDLLINVENCKASSFKVFSSVKDGDMYKQLNNVQLQNDLLRYTVRPYSATSFVSILP